VVSYCDADTDCAQSRRLAELLALEGLSDVRVLRGGFPEWLDAERPHGIRALFHVSMRRP
jgi:3-mercaptopyruvate sulfurtransferase SseA